MRHFCLILFCVSNISFSLLNSWSSKVESLMSSLFTFNNVKEVLNPVIPLKGVSVDEIAAAELRSLQRVKMEDEMFVIFLMKHLNRSCLFSKFCIQYLEDMTRKQLISVIGREVNAEDFNSYMSYHNRSNYSEDQFKAFCYAVRRDRCHPEGYISLERFKEHSETVLVETFVCEEKKRQLCSMKISSATTVSMNCSVYFHSFVQNAFFENTENPAFGNLAVRSNPFSCFLVCIGRLTEHCKFDPVFGIVVRDKCEILIPLTIDSIPSAAEFKKQIVSISPNMQTFSTMYRQQQLDQSLFAIAVIPLKEQMEMVLALPRYSLVKEISLFNSLLDVFIDWQIPPDMLKGNNVAQVKLNVERIQLIVEIQKIREMENNLFQHELEQKKKPVPLQTTGDSSRLSLDDFDLLRVIGKGPSGKVLQVRKKDSGHIFAMKVISRRNDEEGSVYMSKGTKLKPLDCPFLANTHYIFDEGNKRYIVSDYVSGGELYFHMQRERKFEEKRVLFYCAEIVVALQFLHENGVILQSLKPENILLDNEGHIKLTDFNYRRFEVVSEKYEIEGITRAFQQKSGLFGSKKSTQDTLGTICISQQKSGNEDDDRTSTFCGTPEYLSPEILMGTGHGKASDYWSLGTAIYEMATGLPPFYSQDIQTMYSQILHGDLKVSTMSEELGDLCSKLLRKDPLHRLHDIDALKCHPFWKSINWKDVEKRNVTSPFIPRVNDASDTTMIDCEFTQEVVELSKISPSMTDFEGFTFGTAKENPLNEKSGSSKSSSTPGKNSVGFKKLQNVASQNQEDFSGFSFATENNMESNVIAPKSLNEQKKLEKDVRELQSKREDMEKRLKCLEREIATFSPVKEEKEMEEQRVYDGRAFNDLPFELDALLEKNEPNGCLRPSILTFGGENVKKESRSLLGALEKEELSKDEQKSEKNKCFDVLDALSKSGSLEMQNCSLHVVLATTYFFDRAVLDLLVQKNQNPIEEIDRAQRFIFDVVFGTK